MFVIQVYGQSKKDPVFSVFLIGDAGYNVFPDSTLRMLKSELLSKKYNGKSAVVFLGDNIYPAGLAPENGKKNGKVNHGLGELVCKKEVNETTSIVNRKKLMSQLSGLQNYSGFVYMIPGNHDWQKGQGHGQILINNERDAVNSFFRSGILMQGGFFPTKAFGPEHVLLDSVGTSKIRLIFLDTQWYLQTHHRKTDYLDKNCWKRKDEMLDSCLNNLSQILNSARLNKEYVIITAHHPVYTFGKHGKHAKINGSLVAARMYNQHVGSKRYDKLSGAIDSVINNHASNNLIYVAGHDHNLQYFKLKNYIQLVSGAGSKTTNSNPDKVYVPHRFYNISELESMSGSFNNSGFFRIDFLSGTEIEIHSWDEKSGERQPHEFEFQYSVKKHGK
jgi:hypothetical protein